MPFIPACRGRRISDLQFQASQSYTEKPCVKLFSTMGSGQWFVPFTSSRAQAHFRGGMTRPACEGTQCWTGGQTGNAPLNIISSDPQRSRVGRWTPAGQPRVAVLKRTDVGRKKWHDLYSFYI